MMMLTIDEHSYTVTAADGQPIKATKTDMLIINPGERYDILVKGLTNPSRNIYPIIIETLEHYNKTGGKIEPYFGAAKLFYEDVDGNGMAKLKRKKFSRDG